MQPLTSDRRRDLADTLYARFFSGLADETRLRIVRYLLERPRTVGEIVRELGLSQSRISNHLSCLKWCGFVTAQRQGRNVVYEVADCAIADLLSIAQRLVLKNASHIAACTQITP